jgi:Flp pilus assembly protein TadD
LSADNDDLVQLDAAVASLRELAPDAPATEYYAAVSTFVRGDAAGAVSLAERIAKTHPQYAPVYDLVGAAYTRLGEPERAKAAFEASLRFDPHDSTAYTNLGLLELAAGNGDAAARQFAEALWLAPDSATAREGLQRAKNAR